MNSKLITVKKMLLLLLFVVTVMAVTACGRPVPAAEAGSDKTRTVVDAAGRSVQIPDTVHRVGCLYAFAGHVTVLLGEEEKIVAVVAGLKRDKLLTALFPGILELKVPLSEDAINIEELVSLDPDVVFIRRATSDDPDEMRKLDSFGIPAVVVDSNTIDEQRRSVQVVAEVCGGQALAKAEAYDAIYQKAVDTAKEKAARIPAGRKITVYHAINEATRTDIKGTLPAEWTALVGVENVSANKELNAFEGKMYASLEQIYTWDPQMIICNEPGVGRYILQDEKWRQLAAVLAGDVHQMPIAISRWGHPGSMETPLAIYWLGKLAYPEIYADVDLKEVTRNFYRTFFAYELGEAEIESILAGEGMRLAKTQQ